MCQLTLISLPTKQEIREYLYNQLYIDSYTDHNDGFGIYQPGNDFFKCELTPGLTLDMGKIIFNFVKNDNPTFGHVRKAASGVGGFKVVTKENAHPFFFDQLVLFHNGVLVFRDKKLAEEKEFLGKTDSWCFGYLLNKEYDGTNFKEALVNTMEKFHGTFAFLIYLIQEDKYIAAVGTTKKLHVADLFRGKEKVGIVLNTNYDDLKKVVLFTSNHLQLLGLPAFTHGDILPIKENTIVEIKDNDLVHVGEIRETPIPKEEKTNVAIVPAQAWNRGEYEEDYENVPTTTTGGTNISYRKDRAPAIEGKKLPAILGDLVEYMNALDLNLEELDELIYSINGKSLCSLENYDDLLLYIFPILDTLFIEKGQQKNISRVWYQILTERTGENPLEILKEEKLQFPYYLNDINDLKKLLKEYKKNKEKK